MLLKDSLKVILFLAPLVLFSPCQSQNVSQIKHVNPFIGVYGGGNTHPAATLPYSAVSLGPDVEYVQSPSGYGYTGGKKLIGFSHARTSGTGGGGRYGNFLVMPQTGKLNINNKATEATKESASPGSYRCELEGGKIGVSLTLSAKVGFHQYIFNQGDTGNIIVDVSSTRLTKEKSRCTEANIHILSNKSLEGYAKYEGGWGGNNPYTVYFYAEFDQPSQQYGTWDQNIILPENKSASSKRKDDLSLGGFFRFKLHKPGAKINFKLAMSYLGIQEAKTYFGQVPTWSYQTVVKSAEQKWDKFLSRIVVTGGSEDQKKLFYTSFYRTAMIPRDLTGDNPLWKSSEPHFWDFYTFWDTYRTVNPLLNLIDQRKSSEIIRCLLDIYKHRGWMPDAWTGGDYGEQQGGTNADVVVAEAIVKGVKGFDYDLAYRAMVNDTALQSSNPRASGRYLDTFRKYGYLPTESLKKRGNPACGTSRTLEYCYNDFCIALAAKKLGKLGDYRKFLDRSASVFKTLYNDSLKVFWARDSHGKWLDGYVPNNKAKMINGEWSGWWGPYYEGSALTYSCSAQQDIAQIIRRHGGNRAFIQFLDGIFDSGNYESDNEPGMHLPWMYIYAGDSHKTFERITPILKNNYRVAKDGWPGNDDAGTTSAWYMWGSMGIYPMAGQDIYLLTTPAFSKSVFNLGGHKKFIIECIGLTKKNTYIQSIKLNSKPLNQVWIRHKDMIKGGKLELFMGSHPSKLGKQNLPPSFEQIAN